MISKLSNLLNADVRNISGLTFHVVEEMFLKNLSTFEVVDFFFLLKGFHERHILSTKTHFKNLEL